MGRATIVATLNRVFCGITFVMHGIPKVSNFEATASSFEQMGVPAWTAVPVGLLELFGGIALILGLLTRPLAALFIAQMVVVATVVHLPNGWLVTNGGVEFSIAMAVLLVGVLLLGPGRPSIDAVARGRGRQATRVSEDPSGGE